MSDTIPFTFEDIEPYTFIRWRGRPAWVIDKGDHLLPKTNAEHLYIEYDDDDESMKPDTHIHENIVRRELSSDKSERRLWVDFGRRLFSEGEQNATA